ncbi:1-phosphatidylinositol 4 [Diplonema papillatum]|nr:1-phosphatidylinositol 4 [Diplonema papillatum]
MFERPSNGREQRRRRGHASSAYAGPQQEYRPPYLQTPSAPPLDLKAPDGFLLTPNHPSFDGGGGNGRRKAARRVHSSGSLGNSPGATHLAPRDAAKHRPGHRQPLAHHRSHSDIRGANGRSHQRLDSSHLTPSNAMAKSRTPTHSSSTAAADLRAHLAAPTLSLETAAHGVSRGSSLGQSDTLFGQLQSLQGAWYTAGGRQFVTVTGYKVKFTTPDGQWVPPVRELATAADGKPSLLGSTLASVQDGKATWSDGDVWMRRQPWECPPATGPVISSSAQPPYAKGITPVPSPAGRGRHVNRTLSIPLYERDPTTPTSCKPPLSQQIALSNSLVAGSRQGVAAFFPVVLSTDSSMDDISAVDASHESASPLARTTGNMSWRNQNSSSVPSSLSPLLLHPYNNGSSGDHGAALPLAPRLRRGLSSASSLSNGVEMLCASYAKPPETHNETAFLREMYATNEEDSNRQPIFDSHRQRPRADDSTERRWGSNGDTRAHPDGEGLMHKITASVASKFAKNFGSHGKERSPPSHQLLPADSARSADLRGDVLSPRASETSSMQGTDDFLAEDRRFSVAPAIKSKSRTPFAQKMLACLCCRGGAVGDDYITFDEDQPPPPGRKGLTDKLHGLNPLHLLDRNNRHFAVEVTPQMHELSLKAASIFKAVQQTSSRLGGSAYTTAGGASPRLAFLSPMLGPAPSEDFLSEKSMVGAGDRRRLKTLTNVVFIALKRVPGGSALSLPQRWKVLQDAVPSSIDPRTQKVLSDVIQQQASRHVHREPKVAPPLRPNIRIVELWWVVDGDCSGRLDFKEIRQLMGLLNVSIKPSVLKKKLAVFDADGNGELDFFEFVAFNHALQERSELTTLYQEVFASTGGGDMIGGGDPGARSSLGYGASHNGPYAESREGEAAGDPFVSALLRFLMNTQREESATMESATALGKEWSVIETQDEIRPDLSRRMSAVTAGILSPKDSPTNRSPSVSHMTLPLMSRRSDPPPGAPVTHWSLQTFSQYLVSPENSWCDPKAVSLTHDMSQPLCHYFINSSHNTYLSGDQVMSDSKASMYTYALLRGCRCVEVDCWDGPDGEPVVWHGHTKTTKIPFKDVIAAIDAAAFRVSPFPVIISLELHTSPAQQERMVEHMKEIFGDKLHPKIAPSVNHLDHAGFTPNALRNKILLKGPMLAGALESSRAGMADFEEKSDDEPALPDNPPTSKSASKHRDMSPALSDTIFLKNTKLRPGGPAEHVPPLNRIHEITSLSELIAEKQLKTNRSALIHMNKTAFTRIYPKGTRFKSGNMAPSQMWAAGCQAVALNFQTPDPGMRLNHAFFKSNGACGYVLKPPRFRARQLDPLICTLPPKTLLLTVISGGNLPKPNLETKGEIIDPFVEILVNGSTVDDVPTGTLKTKVVEDNGFSPLWNQTFKLTITEPDIALLTVRVIDYDTVGSHEFVAEASCPVLALRQGYRSIPLNDAHYRCIPGCFLLVKIDVR